MRRAGLLACLFAALPSACATVHPFERELLSQPAMTFGEEASESMLDHTLGYRKDAGGQSTVQGGGCGCN